MKRKEIYEIREGRLWEIAAQAYSYSARAQETVCKKPKDRFKKLSRMCFRHAHWYITKFCKPEGATKWTIHRRGSDSLGDVHCKKDQWFELEILEET